MRTPPMLWIGGAPGAGKTAIAWLLSREYDLPLHSVDLWTYDHAQRQPPARSLSVELAQGPRRAADAFVRTARERFPLIVDDVTDRGWADVPVLVEGPQLFPSFAETPPAGDAAWLIPDPQRTQETREERLVAVSNAQQQAGLPVLLARDALLAQQIRREAMRRGYAVIDVGAAADWSAVRAATAAALSLADRERLGAGTPLQAARQQENRAALRQGRLWQKTVKTAIPPFGYGCECGRSQCHGRVRLTTEQYAERAAAGPVRADGH